MMFEVNVNRFLQIFIRLCWDGVAVLPLCGVGVMSV